MKILGIETSCDETALALLEGAGQLPKPHFTVRAEVVHSQIETHKPFGGVFPMMAKREHAKNLIPLFKELLIKAGWLTISPSPHVYDTKRISATLKREPELLKQFLESIPSIEKPPIDAIAVTHGPGLEPALWVGINFATALGAIWSIPVIPTNHMEGHIASVLLPDAGRETTELVTPAVALLISGGHTELIAIRDLLHYSLIGQTHDDAVGEAFDKVARLLNLPYPGGPQISRLAKEARERDLPMVFALPRPMLHSKDYDFSFSGIKTSVLYQMRKLGVLSYEQKAAIAREFEDAVTQVLVEKTRRAIVEYGAKSLVIGGGVVANEWLRNSFARLLKEMPEVKLFVPQFKHSTDNATMIAAAGYLHCIPSTLHQNPEIRAQGNLKLHA